MTKKEQSPYVRALARAAQGGVQVVEDLGDHWLVHGSDGVTRYIVQMADDGLRCTCPSRHYCKHLAVCQQRLDEQQAEREQALAEALEEDAAHEQQAAEASTALMLVEHSERTLAGQTYSQEERLRALAYLPVAIASYAVVLGPAHGWQWHQSKEEQWERYQAARIGNYLCG